MFSPRLNRVSMTGSILRGSTRAAARVAPLARTVRRRFGLVDAQRPLELFDAGSLDPQGRAESFDPDDFAAAGFDFRRGLLNRRPGRYRKSPGTGLVRFGDLSLDLRASAMADCAFG
jgi:hypothetical protein